MDTLPVYSLPISVMDGILPLRDDLLRGLMATPAGAVTRFAILTSTTLRIPGAAA